MLYQVILICFCIGSGKEIFQRELLCLDVLADLEIENYTGKRLEAKTCNFIMKVAFSGKCQNSGANFN